MDAIRIAGANRFFQAPDTWDATQDGPCGTLAVREEVVGATLLALISAWLPTPEERAALAAGAPVHLTVLGAIHPVVGLSVGAVPEPAPAAAPAPNALAPVSR